MSDNVLEYRNNWMADEYYVAGRRIKDLREVLIGNEPANIIGRDVSVPYHDMGHTYSATSRHYFVVVEKYGIRFEHDLNTLVGKTKIIPTDFDYA